MKQLSGMMLAVLLLSLAACRSKGPQEEEEAEGTGIQDEIILSGDQIKLAGIQFGKLQERVLSDEVRCNGKVEVSPRGRVSISLPMEGYVRKINIYEGSEVRKGDLLALMQHPNFLNLQQEYLVTGNDLQMLKADLSRQEILAREDAASEKKLMAAKTQYDNVLIQHTSLGEKLKMMGIDPTKINAGNMSSEVGIYSPINGFVRENYANTGLLISAGSPILELEDNSQLHVHLSVYEQEISLLKKGQQVEFRTGSGDKEYRGEIYLVGRSIDNRNKSAVVLVKISNPDKSLLSGMYVKARILIGQTKVLSIPESGIAMEGDNRYVFIRDGSSFRRIQVETGIQRDGYVEIREAGSMVDEEFVVAGAYYLNAGFSEE